MNKPIEEIELLGCQEAFEANTLKEAESQPIKKDWLAKKPNGNYLEPSVYSAYQGWKACWQLRTPSISYGDAVEKVSMAIVTELKRQNLCEDKDVGRTKYKILVGVNEGIASATHLAKAALAAMGIEEGKE